MEIASAAPLACASRPVATWDGSRRACSKARVCRAKRARERRAPCELPRRRLRTLSASEACRRCAREGRSCCAATSASISPRAGARRAWGSAGSRGGWSVVPEKLALAPGAGNVGSERSAPSQPETRSANTQGSSATRVAAVATRSNAGFGPSPRSGSTESAPGVMRSSPSRRQPVREAPAHHQRGQERGRSGRGASVPRLHVRAHPRGTGQAADRRQGAPGHEGPGPRGDRPQ
jgi:hypothetical protein